MDVVVVPPLDHSSQPPAGSTVLHLGAEHVEIATSVLSESFYDYPVMRYVLGSEDGYDDRIKTLIRFFVLARVFRQEHVLGVRDETDFGAVALVSNPDGPESPPEFGTIRESVWEELGQESRRRYEHYSATCKPIISSARRIHLNMIGVRPRSRGSGLGRRLLEHVHLMSAGDPKSTGVSLTTEDQTNLDLYKHFGYEVVGQARVSSALETWSMFRHDNPPGS